MVLTEGIDPQKPLWLLVELPPLPCLRVLERHLLQCVGDALLLERDPCPLQAYDEAWMFKLA